MERSAVRANAQAVFRTAHAFDLAGHSHPEEERRKLVALP
jgi:hypothetical protein